MNQRREIMIKPDSLYVDSDKAVELMQDLYSFYRQKEIKDCLDLKGNYIPENIIALYVYFVSCTNYQAIVEDYKAQYVENESVVEPGVTKEEVEGIGAVYDYISTFDFTKGVPNIFVEGMKIHYKLYSKCPYPDYGGKLRDGQAMLTGCSYDVPTAAEASAYFQSFISKKYDINIEHILDYIDAVIVDTVSLIKVQPFSDGNKRTFRALLNLMLGKIGLPPVYIAKKERNVYKQCLTTAFEDNNYEPIKRFYYNKICDAIINLDVGKSLEEMKNKESKPIR